MCCSIILQTVHWRFNYNKIIAVNLQVTLKLGWRCNQKVYGMCESTCMVQTSTPTYIQEFPLGTIQHTITTLDAGERFYQKEQLKDDLIHFLVDTPPRGTPRWRRSHDLVTRTSVSCNGSIAIQPITPGEIHVLINTPLKLPSRQGGAQKYFLSEGQQATSKPHLGPVLITDRMLMSSRLGHGLI